MDPVVPLTVSAALALLFGVAAAHKLRAPRAFAATLAEYRVLPARLVPVASAMVVVLEAALAAALLAPAGRRAGLAGGAALLAVYAAAIGVNLARGRRHLDCGCAGPAARRPIHGGLVARNVVLLVVALAALAPVAARPLGWVDAVTVTAATATLAALYAAADLLLASAPAVAALRRPA